MTQSLLVLFVKNEEENILEWLCHHAEIGFDQILVLDNQSVDKTAMVVEKAAYFLPVSYMLWKDDMHLSAGLNKQGAAYDYCMHKYRSTIEWLCFLDADEFLIPPPGGHLHELLDQMSFSWCFSINWMTFGSSNLEAAGGRLVMEAFTQRGDQNDPVNGHVKTFFRPSRALQIINPHYVDVGGPVFNLNGEPIRWTIEGVTHPEDILHTGWRIHHYIIRSREHWVRRMSRKQPDGHARGWHTFSEYDQNDIIDLYAYSSARTVWDRLTTQGYTYFPVSQNSEDVIASINHVAKLSSIICFIDEVSASSLRGWAHEPGGDKPVTLQLLIDDVLVTSFTSDLTRRDVKASDINKEFVGFICRIPSKYLDNVEHLLSLRDEDGNVITFKAEGHQRESLAFRHMFTPQLIGQLDETEQASIRGWAAIARDTELQNFETRCHLLVQSGHRPVASIVADLPRPDVAAAHSIEGRCGFSFLIPHDLRDGTKQIFRVFVMPEMIELLGSPVTIDTSLNDDAERIVRLAKLVDQMTRYISKTMADDTFLKSRMQEAAALAEAIIPSRALSIINYIPWFYRHHQAMSQKVRATRHGPLISVVCPVYQPALHHFRAAIQSVLDQTYKNFELILHDDGGQSQEAIDMMMAMAALDNRIRVTLTAENKGISDATNRCINIARGDWIAFFDHDDLLVDCALDRMISSIKPDVSILYSDEDKIDDDGCLFDPALKPDWNYRYLLGVNYINHLTIIRTDLVRKVGGLRSEFDGAQDHDLLLRCVEQIEANRIVHVPEVLYHWRATSTSTAASVSTKPYVVAAGVKAVSSHLGRRNVPVSVESHPGHSLYRVTVTPIFKASVAVIIPFRDQIGSTERCVTQVIKHTTNHNLTIVLINNNSSSAEATIFIKQMRSHKNVIIIDYEQEFNYSKINNLAVETTESDYIVFMNNDLFVNDDDWLDTMLQEILIDDTVGAVGGKFLYQNRTVQHCGVIIGFGGVAGHAFTHESEFFPGYGARAWLAHQVSAVTAACMLVRRKVFVETGGFDEKSLVIAFNDIDLCLKITKLGYKIIVTPDFVAEHHESLSRGLEDTPEKVLRFNREASLMKRRWGNRLRRDPFYHPAFALTGRPFFDLVAPTTEVSLPNSHQRKEKVPTAIVLQETRALKRPKKALMTAAGPVR
ncbi:glycosyltransferase [Lichenicola cladoniae]|uniref:Glycosyltransferase n=1 Tax=Lichenicola cladoniae TaxID=1484109 RepID=A0A6M8HL35_9PROT|nr:glycosyltransferase [Lichenicola cladoniae]NPD68639.1 glycosyltransferase [Acetobacteraceae bacterium]QKE88895.1 glycosyltransferase [Lichenicola cladoniae]